MTLIISNFTTIESLHNKNISFINPHSYLTLKKNKFNLQSIDLWLSDGFLIGKVMLLFGFGVERASFDYTSLANIVFSWCKENNKKISIVGSDEASITFFVDQLHANFDLKVESHRNGFFSADEYCEYLKKLVITNPDVVVVGMGTPKQEQFLIDLRARGWHGIGFTCGGFIHQTNLNKGKYYPSFIDRFNLRFMYRMWREPSTISRYLINYPIAVTHIILQLFLGKVSGPR